MGGSRTYHNFLDLNLIGHKYEPNLILSYSGFNDYSVPFFFERDASLFSPSIGSDVTQNGGTNQLSKVGNRPILTMTPTENVNQSFGERVSNERFFQNILNPDLSLRVNFARYDPYDAAIVGFRNKQAPHFSSDKEFFDRYIVPLYINSLKAIKRDFPGVPIMVARQAIESIPDEFMTYGDAKNKLGIDFYDKMWARAMGELNNYIDSKWIFLDIHKMYEDDQRIFGLHLTEEAQEIVADAMAQKLALSMDPQYAMSHPEVAITIGNGTYRVRSQKKILGASNNWSEQAYLDANPDVAQMVAEGRYSNGYDHYLKKGKTENRNGSPENWDERDYLQKNPDVLQQLGPNNWSSGYAHFIKAGQVEHRKGGHFRLGTVPINLGTPPNQK
jgi:hypothetical protein